jgi:hypothetical protein
VQPIRDAQRAQLTRSGNSEVGRCWRRHKAVRCPLVWVPPVFDFSKYALNIGVDLSTGAAVELPEGNGPFLPFGGYGILASLPFAVWLFLAIEQLPLAAEKSVDPRRDMPKGIMLGMFILIARVPCSRLQPGHPDRTRNH